MLEDCISEMREEGTPAIVPEFGVYEDVTPEDYRAWPGASSSGLSLLNISPAHYKALRNKPSTKVQDRGTVVHFAVLQPDELTSRYVMAGQCIAVTQKGTQCSNTGIVCRDGSWFCGVRGHDPGGSPQTVIPIGPEDYAAALAARDAVYSHRTARETLAADMREVSLYWQDDETLFPCKARIDHVNQAQGCTVDIKTTRNANAFQFGGDAFRYGYYRQGAWYLDAALRVPGDFLLLEPHHRIVAVECTEPFAVGVFQVPTYLINAAREELRRLLDIYAECMAKDSWPLVGPGWSDALQDLEAPAYALDVIDGRLQTTVEV
jgi:hypothetical protein